MTKLPPGTPQELIDRLATGGGELPRKMGIEFLELSPEYASSISRSVRENQDAVGALGNTQPHNDFLNVWLSFGTMAFAVFVALFVLIGRAFLEGIRRTPDPVLKGIGAGGLGALVAFAANSAFHNFFDSTLTLWLRGGGVQGSVTDSY